MFYKSIKFFVSAVILLLPILASAQTNPEMDAKAREQEKKFDEAMEKQLEYYASALKLDDAQIFFLDSIIRHNNKALVEEIKELNAAKVSNSDYFQIAQDKWMDKTYYAIQAVLNEEQWAKYLKLGAAKSKKDRDKRAAKRNN